MTVDVVRCLRLDCALHPTAHPTLSRKIPSVETVLRGEPAISLLPSAVQDPTYIAISGTYIDRYYGGHGPLPQPQCCPKVLAPIGQVLGWNRTWRKNLRLKANLDAATLACKTPTKAWHAVRSESLYRRELDSDSSTYCIQMKNGRWPRLLQLLEYERSAGNPRMFLASYTLWTT